LLLSAAAAFLRKELIASAKFSPLVGFDFFALFFLFISRPIVAVFLAAHLWLSFLSLLYICARPFPLLIKRRRRIGVSLFAILTVIPFLIWLRQVCINVGQIRKWKKQHSSASHQRKAG
jgi:hypothetical protein